MDLPFYGGTELLRDANSGDANSGREDAKRLWIYDSFEGLPAKTDADFSVAGEAFQAGVLAVSKREVKLRFLRAGLPVPVITKGWFADLTRSDLPREIAFAFGKDIRDIFLFNASLHMDIGQVIPFDDLVQFIHMLAFAVNEELNIVIFL